MSSSSVCSPLCTGRKNLEDKFPHHDWFIVLSLQLLLSISFAITAPSLYQFITTSPNHPQHEQDTALCTIEQDAGRFWPGLGGTESHYAWALASGQLLGVLLIPIVAATTHHLPFSVTMLISLSFYVSAGVVYGLTDKLWMVFFAMVLRGMGAAFGATVIHTYIGELGTQMDQIRKKQHKKPRKFLLYIAYSFILNGGVFITYIITSTMAQFKNINPYHWPGWFYAALATFEAVLVLLFFTATRSLPRKCPTRGLSVSKFKLCLQLRSFRKIQFSTTLYMVACANVIGMMFSIVYSLVAPVLSDTFGFTVEYTSHFYIAVSCVYMASSFIQLGAKIVKTDNRIMLGFALLCGLFGSLLCADWQAIGNDPCFSAALNDSVNLNTFNGSCNGTYADFNTTILDEYSPFYNESIRICEAQSTSDNHCFWNPKSRITGEFCNTCVDSCLSEQKSMNFYQFGLGVLLATFSSSFGHVYISAVTSDITPVESQGLALSVILGSGMSGRGFTPLWYLEVYKWNDRHTLFPMAITAACSLVLFISLLVLYKKLAPRPSQIQEKPAASNALTFTDLNVSLPGCDTKETKTGFNDR